MVCLKLILIRNVEGTISQVSVKCGYSSSGEDVVVSGFGKFCVKEKRERRGRNPVTGESMMIEARRVVTFKCSGQLRDNINKSGSSPG
jgi:integration host factor subunit alpha